MKLLSQYDLVIAGGGLAALFTAYETLKRARVAGRNFDILVVADRINAPCPAGSQLVLELEGMFQSPAKKQKQLAALLRQGYQVLKDTIVEHDINCRFTLGYEIKSKTEEDLLALLSAMENNGVYSTNEVEINTGHAKFNLPVHPYSANINCIGQINAPELIGGILNAFKNLGGHIIEGANYKSHHYADGRYVIETSNGVFYATRKPLIATGAEHQKSLPDFPLPDARIVYTMCCIMGPLSTEDATRLSHGPVAMCDIEFEKDVLWGGLDKKNIFTLGRGVVLEPTHENRNSLYEDICAQIESFYPGLTKTYKPDYSFGAILVAKNRMPIVGRLKDYDITGGWAGMGIVAGYTAANAYAKWIIDEDESGMEIFESLQPEIFN